MKKLHATSYEQRMYKSFGNDTVRARGYLREVAPRSIVYLLTKDGKTFGYIVYLVKSYDRRDRLPGFAKLKLLRSILNVYNGQVPAPEHHLSGFIVGKDIYSMHDPIQNALKTALALGTTVESAKLVA